MRQPFQHLAKVIILFGVTGLVLYGPWGTARAQHTYATDNPTVILSGDKARQAVRTGRVESGRFQDPTGRWIIIWRDVLSQRGIAGSPADANYAVAIKLGREYPLPETPAGSAPFPKMLQGIPSDTLTLTVNGHTGTTSWGKTAHLQVTMPLGPPVFQAVASGSLPPGWKLDVFRTGFGWKELCIANMGNSCQGKGDILTGGDPRYALLEIISARVATETNLVMAVEVEITWTRRKP